MKVRQVKRRSLVWTFDSSPEWNLNVQLIHGDRYDYVIDTGLGAGSVAPVMERLRPGRPVVVVNTHHHWDHVWGNAALDGALIVSHRLCRQRLEAQWDDMITKHRRYIDGSAAKRLPDAVFEDGLYFPADGIRLFHTPGHTEDGISVFDERDGVLNVGDNIGDDADHLVPELECDKALYDKVLEQYIALGAEVVVSGHNDVLSGGVFGEIRKLL